MNYYTIKREYPSRFPKGIKRIGSESSSCFTIREPSILAGVYGDGPGNRIRLSISGKFTMIQELTAIRPSTDQLNLVTSDPVTGNSKLSLADTELLEGLRAGHREAFEQLVLRFQNTIYNLAYRLLNDPEEARDITQDIFLKIYRSAGSFRGESEFKTWIYRITVNQVANQQRWWRRRRHRETLSLETSQIEEGIPLADQLASEIDDPEQRTLLLERQRHLAAALAELKFDFRVAVILRDVKGLSYEEIAETLQISIGTVKSRIARGREELRCRLKGHL